MTTTPNRTITGLIDEHLATWSEPGADRRLARIKVGWEADGGIVVSAARGRSAKPVQPRGSTS